MRLIGKLVVIPTLFLIVTSMSVFAKDAPKHFTDTDTNKDGKLSADEVAAAAAKRADSRVEELLKKHDANGDGCISKDEMKEKKAQKMGLTAADADNDGKLTKEELTSFFRKKMSERAMASFKAHDANSDGFVTLDEIKQFKMQDGAKKDGAKKEGIDAIVNEIDDLFSK